MKMGRRVVPFGALVMALVLVTQTTAMAQQTGQWTGVTDQGVQMGFTVQPGQPEYIDSWSFGFNITCPDGQQIGAGVGFSGFNVPIVDNKFSFKYKSVFFIFSWHGVFQNDTSASGVAIHQLPAFVYPTNATQDCKQKVRWTAGAGIAAPRHYQHFTQVTRHPDGSVTVSALY
jgi:hypothetical protein